MCTEFTSKIAFPATTHISPQNDVIVQIYI